MMGERQLESVKGMGDGIHERREGMYHCAEADII